MPRPSASDALNITFIQATAPTSATKAVQARPPAAKAAVKPKVTKVTPKTPPVRRPAIIAQRAPNTPQSPQSQEKPVETPPIATAAPEMDMSTMIEAARAKRRAAAGQTADADNGGDGQTPAADNAIAMANIKFITQRGEGGGGVFEIVRKGPSSAQYAFRGWGGTARENRRQLIEVSVGADGNVNVAIVKSMIELIRKRYSGDFKWDSRRLGKVLTLSARETDGEALQAFLLREFF